MRTNKSKTAMQNSQSSHETPEPEGIVQTAVNKYLFDFGEKEWT